MDAQSALLEEIRQSPEDDAPRLVYADWLEEQADPRAEFIRLQVRLAHMLIDSPERRTLRRRETKMLREFGQRWFGPFKHTTRSARIDRGFITSISITLKRFFDHAESLLELEPVFQVKITNLTRKGAKLAESPILAKVPALSLRYLKVGLDDFRPLIGSPHLRRLRRLNLNWVQPAMGPSGASTLAAESWPCLEELIFSRAELGEDGARRLAAGHFPALHSLALDFNDLRQPAVSALVDSSIAQNLIALSLASNPLGVPGFAALARASTLAQLRVLDLNSTRLGQRGMRDLASAPHLGNLTHLKLANNDLGDAAVQALAQSPWLSNITYLDLTQNGITDVGVKALAASPYTQRLAELRLELNLIGDPGAEALIRSPTLNRLMALTLWGVQPFTERVREQLHERFPYCSFSPAPVEFDD